MGIIRANWGPLNRAVAFEPSTNVNAVFGSGNTEDLITEMFSGGISSGYFVRCGTGGTAPTIIARVFMGISSVLYAKILITSWKVKYTITPSSSK